jgi:uncharacterized paraquat-inducible protein A
VNRETRTLLKKLYFLFAVGVPIIIVLRALLGPVRQDRSRKVREREEKAEKEPAGTLAAPAQPRVLVCPNCGYPQAADRTSCPYCDVPLVAL